MAEPTPSAVTTKRQHSGPDRDVDARATHSLSRATDASESYVLSRIETAQSALWRAELTRRILTIVIALLASGLAWLVWDQWIYPPGTVGRSIFALGLVVALIAYAYLRLWPVMHLRINEDYAARALERDHPELGHALSSYISLRRQRAEHPQGQLAQRVVQSVGNTAASKLRLIDAVPSEATGLMAWWAATIILIAALAIYTLTSPKNSVQSIERLIRPMASLEAPKRVRISDVSPGNTESLAGRSLQVAAKVANLRDDEPVYFRWETNQPRSDLASTEGDAAGKSTSRDQVRLLPGETGDGLNRFTASVPISHHAQGKRRYRIVAGDASAGPYEVSIWDTPVVQIREVVYDPPTYTGKPRRTSHTGALRGVDGTRVKLVATVNRPITRAVIEFNPRKVGRDIQATAGTRDMQVAPDGTTVDYTFPLRLRGGAAIALQDYRLRVWDDADQPNADPIVYPIEIVEDLPPEITIVVPQQSSVDVPINGQQEFEIHAADVDFGLAEIEIEIRRGIDLIARSSLWKDSRGKQGKQVAEYRFRPSRIIVAGRADGVGARRGSGLNVGDELEVVAIATDNRMDPNDDTIVPGVTKTTPLRLRIVAAAQQEAGAGSEGEGETGAGSEGEGETGALSEGEGEAGAGSEGEGETGAGSEGEGETGAGSEGKGEQGKGEQGKGEQGKGEQGTGEQGTGEQGKGEQGKGEQGKGEQGKGEQSKGEQSKGEPGKGEQGKGEPGKGEPGKGEPGTGEQGEGEMGESGSGDSEQTKGEEASNGQPSEAGGSSGGESDGENASSGEASGDEGQSQQENANSRTGERGSSSERQSSQPPQDDAEAFERIQEYLKQNQKNQQSANFKKGDDQAASDQLDEGQNGKGKDAEGQQGEDRRGEDQRSNEQRGEGARNEQGTGNDGQNQNGDDSEPMNGQSQPDGAQGPRGEKGSSENDRDGGRDGKTEGNGAGDKSGGDKSGDPSSSSADNTESEANPSNAENVADQQGSQDGDGLPSKPQNSEGQTGEGQTGESNRPTGNQGKGNQREQPTGDNQNGRGDEGSEKGSETTDSGDPKSSQDRPESSGNPSQGDQSTDSTTSPNSNETESSQGGGGGQSGGGEDNATATEDELPDPVDLDYTKAATDMVLDYLDETRTDPDPDLLQRLKWTEQDLRRFRQRWKSVKPLDDGPPSGATSSNEIEEALRSLGMRPPQTTQSTRRDTADELRNLRDSGNRRPAPADVREAFEAFRRGLGQSSRGADK